MGSVFSNTGGQNSDSSTMLGGYDMNQFGIASQGKLIEKKNVAEAFIRRVPCFCRDVANVGLAA